MKYFYFVILKLVFLVNFGANGQPLFPNLPTGEHRVYFKAIIKCKNSENSDFQFNWKLTKTSINTTELMGNVTLKTLFDDSHTLLINLAVKDSIGGWKDNYIQHKAPKACTTMKGFLGSGWSLLINGHNLNNTNCPIPKGVYQLTKSFDLTTIISMSHFPKVFFYGTYKMRFSFNDKFDKESGCIVFVIEVKRPWETI
ncbi:uncharacterized protein LOC112687491 [Sipha flava]|uniref:Uncharacterized protein LOC112687491 n=1 Tax=Sipha flava TaxID=143950 RepID=A0A2S2R127_9HEMI|nr:uncharacterized protein LOC112687491 [Sipha flava]